LALNFTFIRFYIELEIPLSPRALQVEVKYLTSVIKSQQEAQLP